MNTILLDCVLYCLLARERLPPLLAEEEEEGEGELGEGWTTGGDDWPADDTTSAEVCVCVCVCVCFRQRLDCQSESSERKGISKCSLHIQTCELP